jgi:hypothetical protein
VFAIIPPTGMAEIEWTPTRGGAVSTEGPRGFRPLSAGLLPPGGCYLAGRSVQDSWPKSERSNCRSSGVRRYGMRPQAT